MDILIGTTNPSKVKRFEDMLAGCGLTFRTLHDLSIEDEPEETGSSPVENSIIKAEFYGRYFDPVICNDSGLYIDGLALDDPRQPGLNIRTPLGGKRLGDEEMIDYYSSLVHSLGGRVKAYYLDSVAVFREGKTYSFQQESDTVTPFYLIDKPSDRRHPGWPLDSISLNISSLTYFTDPGGWFAPPDEDYVDVHYLRVVAFLKNALGIGE